MVEGRLFSLAWVINSTHNACLIGPCCLIPISCMAQDFICTDLQGSLKVETVSQALLSKVWIRSGLFDVNELLKRKSKHSEIDP